MFSSSSRRLQEDRGALAPNALPDTSDAPDNAAVPPTSEHQTEIKLEVPEPRLSLTFTCTVTKCHTRSTHQFTRRSYEKGIKVSDAEMAALDIAGEAFHPEWNYTIKTRHPRRSDYR